MTLACSIKPGSEQDAKARTLLCGSSANLRRLRPLFLAEDHTRSYILPLRSILVHPNISAGRLLRGKRETSSRISQLDVCFDLPVRYIIDLSSIIPADPRYVSGEWLLSGPLRSTSTRTCLCNRATVSRLRAWYVARLPTMASDRLLISIEIIRTSSLQQTLRLERQDVSQNT